MLVWVWGWRVVCVSGALVLLGVVGLGDFAKESIVGNTIWFGLFGGAAWWMQAVESSRLRDC